MRQESGKIEQEKSATSLYAYLMPYKWVFFPSLAALLLTAMMSLAFPYLMKDLIGGPADALISGEEVEVAVEKVNTTVRALLIILSIQAVFVFFRVQGFVYSAENAVADISKDVFGRILKLPMSFFMEQSTGEVSARISSDLVILRETLTSVVPQIFRQSVILVGGLIFIFISSTKLASFMLATIPVVVIAVSVFGRKIKALSKKAQDELAESNVVIEESIQSIANVKSFGNEAVEENRYADQMGAFLGSVKKTLLPRASFISFIISVMFGTIAVVAWFGAGMVAHGEISSVEFTSFILFSIFVGASLASIPELFTSISKTNGATQRIVELLNEEVELDEGVLKTIKGGSVSINKVDFAYPSNPDQLVLKQVSFDLKQGGKMAIVGASGAGKSTIIHLMQRLYEVNTGVISIDEQALSEYELKVLRSQVSVVAQDVVLFGGSIFDNIAYGRSSASKEEVIDAAKSANCLEFVDRLENGFDTKVGPRGMKLSGGQRQRIAIARAILANPKILLLDEATSALDSENERLVQEALNSLMENRTTIIVAHRLATIQHCDQIVVLNEGHIVEKGTHESLIAAGGLYKVLASTQFI